MDKLAPAAGLDLRGVELSAAHLIRILARFDDGTRIRLGDVRFNHAWFSGDAEFDGAAFGETADFTGAWFCGPARFNDITCTGRLSFMETQFDGYAQIRWCQVPRLTLNRAFARVTDIDVQAEEVYIDSACFEGGSSFVWVQPTCSRVALTTEPLPRGSGTGGLAVPVVAEVLRGQQERSRCRGLLLRRDGSWATF